MLNKIEEARDSVRELGSWRIAHPVVLHHLRKEFRDLDVTKDYFYILPIKDDFLHVAIIEYDTGKEERALMVKYAAAGDDLLYGLRIKFACGGSLDPDEDLAEIIKLVNEGTVRDHPRYVRKRFRHGRFQAKFRAMLIYLKDRWRTFFPKTT